MTIAQDLIRKEMHQQEQDQRINDSNQLNHILKANIKSKEELIARVMDDIIELQGEIVNLENENAGLRRLLERCMKALKPENKEEI